MELPKPPRRQSPRCKANYIVKEEHVPRAEWNPVSKRVFLEAAYDEVMKGNFNKGILLPQGWRNVRDALWTKMNRPYKISQVKNEWGKIKAEWVIVKNLLHRLTGAGLDAATRVLLQEPQWWAETIAADSRMAAYANQDLRPWRDIAPILFDGSLATGEFAVAPSNYSNIHFEGGIDMVDSEPDTEEGSGDSGGKTPLAPVPIAPFSSSGRGSGSSGKRKCIDLNTCMIPSVRRKLPMNSCMIPSVSMASAQTSNTSNACNKGKQLDHTPTVKQCMDLINYLECSDIDLYVYALSLLREDVNRQILFAIPTRKGIEHWLKTMMK